MHQIQIRGRLPAILLLVGLGALLALVISASLAVALPVAGALLLVGLARSIWYRLTGRSPAAFTTTTFRTIRIEPRGPGPSPRGPADDEGPVVDALPRRGPPGPDHPAG